MSQAKKKEEKEVENLTLPSSLYFEDPISKEKGVIESPTLISLFWSKRFQEEYIKDPEKEWSIQELMECMVLKPKSSSTIRKNIDANQDIFVKFKGIRLRDTDGGLIAVNLVKFKPVMKIIIDALKAMLGK